MLELVYALSVTDLIYSLCAYFVCQPLAEDYSVLEKKTMIEEYKEFMLFLCTSCTKHCFH